MKFQKTILLMGALAAVCLTACDNAEENGEYDGEVRFTAAINNQAVATPQTRAAGTAWGKGDEIGIFMLTHQTGNIIDDASNRKYTTSAGDGNFSAEAGDRIYFPMDDSPVYFIAYYPYTTGFSLDANFGLAIPTEQNADLQAGCDLMWAKVDNEGAGYKKSDKAAPALSFSHCLAKLTMNCKVDASVGAASMLDAATVTIHGMNIRATFDLNTGKLATAPNTNMVGITPRRFDAPDGFHGAYDAIILPDKYAGGTLTVDFALNGEIFTWVVDAIDFQPGNEYIYEVTITRSGVEATGKIKPWMPVYHSPVTAE